METCDILVIGDGIAGCMAALAANAQGANVLVIEKAPKDVPHSNTAFSGGSFRRTSQVYPAEKFYQDMISLSGGRADPELTKIMVEKSRQARDWLTALGVPWTSKSRDPGAADQVDGQGKALAEILRRAVAARNIKIHHETEAYGLILESERIRGARVKTAAGNSEIRSQAVILAAGGFQANPEMVTRYLGPGGNHLVLRGSPYNTGDGIRMALEVGAKIDWMDDFHGGLIHYGYKQHLEEGAMAGMRSMKKYEVGILVNQQGSRFVDEGEYPSDKTYAKFGKLVALTQPGGVAYVIFDSATKETINPDYTGPDRGPIEAGSIRELATKLEIDPGALEHTVTAYNDSIQGEKCPSLRPPKTNFACRIEEAPFCAYKVTGGLTFTFGGLWTNTKGQVLDSGRKPIPALYAAGEITTGIFYGNYAGGSSLPRCAVYGRIAGESAAEYIRP
ncbi:MAG: FAD-dependent tricarballylate dehydrogenase TcuA [Deltaproteobacteria bacterium]|nr:FAD-dependent tricarballylate dehydrogenase TcuA [Deltaproteobacteria bacterium]